MLALVDEQLGIGPVSDQNHRIYRYINGKLGGRIHSTYFWEVQRLTWG
jgi:hypothetical protein